MRTPEVKKTVVNPNGSIDIFFNDEDLESINITPNESSVNVEAVSYKEPAEVLKIFTGKLIAEYEKICKVCHFNYEARKEDKELITTKKILEPIIDALIKTNQELSC
jgi:hypothetical protein